MPIAVNLPIVAQNNDGIAPPCFFWKLCSERAAMEKAGRAVCRRCAGSLRGVEYPLRNPSLQPIYLTGRAAAEDMDMLDD